MENKITFAITFHEGKGHLCGNYETLEKLNGALRKLGKRTAEGYTKTDVSVFLNGALVWKGQVEPDFKGNETDFSETLRTWAEWYSSENAREFLGVEDSQKKSRFFSWLNETISLFQS